MNMQLKQNCEFFKTDIPCVYHKRDGVKCSECKNFSEVGGSILIIKKEAKGDVLRTTSILEPLKEKFPKHRVIWLTAKKNKDVLEGNPYIDIIWDEVEAPAAISLFKFDILINLDLSPDSLTAAGIAKAGIFYGFRYRDDWNVECSNKAAEEWFLMSHDDEVKRNNRKTYQKFIADITELTHYGEIIVPLQKTSVEKAKRFAKKYNLSGKKVIGIHTGSGYRWPTKRWPQKHIKNLLKMLTDKRYTVLLFGGEEEKEIMEELTIPGNPYIISTGCNNTIPDFFALLNLCDVVVSADTLAMHAATGLKKKVVALFGPTSPCEIEEYGRIKKVITPLDCFCCYKRECDKTPSCMEEITPETVYSVIERCL